MIFSKSFFHKHVISRLDKVKDIYPHKNKYAKAVDNSVYFVGIVTPLISSVQLIKIIKERDASSLSLVTWIIFLISSVAWMIYGIVHKENEITLSNLLFVIVNALIIGGIIWFR